MLVIFDCLIPWFCLVTRRLSNKPFGWQILTLTLTLLTIPNPNPNVSVLSLKWFVAQTSAHLPFDCVCHVERVDMSNELFVFIYVTRPLIESVLCALRCLRGPNILCTTWSAAKIQIHWNTTQIDKNIDQFNYTNYHFISLYLMQPYKFQRNIQPSFLDIKV